MKEINVWPMVIMLIIIALIIVWIGRGVTH